MRKQTIMLILRLAAAVLGLSLVMPGCGRLGVQPGIRAEIMMTGGDKVRLYYGGPQDAKEMFCIGETVSVFRAYPQDRLRYIEVGKVRITGSIDRSHMEGVVVEGKVKEGDLARKSIAACKVLPPEPAAKYPNP
ncbi:MAG TPA: hypothetical protein VFG19_08050 [Geobacteraceae bacterium]|nr:hypothetical protein [Geobacteraceae bacterium]